MRKRSTLAAVVLAAVITALGVAFTQGFLTPSADSPSSVAGDKVPPIAKAPLTRIAVVGDAGTGGATELATAQQMVDQSRDAAPYDALILLGDLVYEDGDASLVDQAVKDPFAPLVETGTVLVPVLGNHDYKSDEQTQILAALGRNRSWYAERIGSVRVVVLDTERVDDPQQTLWLRNTLAKPQPQGTWTIAAMHRPAYSAGQHGSDASLQARWSPLFAKYGVPLVLAGHDHDYQRSKPIAGVTYVVSGAGAKLRPTGHEDFTTVSSSTLHYLDLLIFKKRLLGRAIDHSGTLVDSFSITR